MRIPDACKERKKLVSVKEGRSHFTIKRADGGMLLEVRIDGCVVTNGERCDFLVRADDTDYFVELKGSDVKKAAAQLLASISMLYNDGALVACIVSSRVPSAGTDTQKAQTVLKKAFSNCEVIVRSRKLSVTH